MEKDLDMAGINRAIRDIYSKLDGKKTKKSKKEKDE
jgi:hypothetical protein